jgi:Arc/MetJ-type ribon-helix-helix transcriptional regulator
VSEQVHSDRFENEAEVVRSALRQTEESERERAMKAFENAFRETDRDSPAGEPTTHDLAEISRIVESVRNARPA